MTAMPPAPAGWWEGLPLGPLAGDIGVVGVVMLVLFLLVTGRLVTRRELDRVSKDADDRVARAVADADARVAREKDLADMRVARERDISEAWQQAWGSERVVSAEALSQRDALADEYAATAKHVLDALPRLASDDEGKT